MDWIAIASAALGSSVLVKLIDIIATAIKEKNGKIDSRTKALQMLLLQNLRNDYKIYKRQEGVDREQYNSYEELYKTYKNLGGNGYADKIYEEVKCLPIINEE